MITFLLFQLLVCCLLNFHIYFHLNYSTEPTKLKNLTMAYQIQYAEESDAPALAQINTLSFQGRGLLSQVFPEASQDALEAYKSMYTMKHLANPQMHVLKVADPASGTTVGYARWHIPESLSPRTNVPVLSKKAQEAARDPFQFAPRPMNEALMAGFRGLLEESRKKHVTEKDMSKDLSACVCV
jgi:hypothetical protein